MASLRFVLALIVVVGLLAGASADARDGQRPEGQGDAVTIAVPATGLVTSARTIEVRGLAPWISPEDGEAVVRVTVNARPLEVFPTQDGYASPVALELGRNEIVVWGKAGRYDDDETVTGTARVVVERRREPGDETGLLDRATAAMLADSTEDAYWLCGEDERCSVEPECFSMGPRRVDCAVAYWYTYNHTRRCGYVYTLRLRGDQLYAGSYRCGGRLNPRPRRLLRKRPTAKLHRVILNPSKDDTWSRFLVNAPNRYGAPRFSMERDVFLP